MYAIHISHTKQVLDACRHMCTYEWVYAVMVHDVVRYGTLWSAVVNWTRVRPITK